LKAIKLAAQGDMAIGGAGLSIRLDDRDATAGDHRTPVFAYVLPLTGSDLRTRLRPTAVAAVFIGTSIDEQRGADATADTFGLTPAESRVLASLLRGATMAETATTLGIAPSTAKTHLERIFSKTGVTRQAELMRLATSLIPPVERGRL
jgi:DNA-binding CsgD family transcriptional regulator